jgi:hypothetical protein
LSAGLPSRGFSDVSYKDFQMFLFVTLVVTFRGRSPGMVVKQRSSPDTSEGVGR